MKHIREDAKPLEKKTMAMRIRLRAIGTRDVVGDVHLHIHVHGIGIDAIDLAILALTGTGLGGKAELEFVWLLMKLARNIIHAYFEEIFIDVGIELDLDVFQLRGRIAHLLSRATTVHHHHAANRTTRRSRDCSHVHRRWTQSFNAGLVQLYATEKRRDEGFLSGAGRLMLLGFGSVRQSSKV